MQQQKKARDGREGQDSGTSTPVLGGDPTAESKEVEPRCEQAIRKSPEQGRVIYEKDGTNWPYLQPPMENAVQGQGSPDKSQHRHGDEKTAGFLYWDDAGQRSYHQIHR